MDVIVYRLFFVIFIDYISCSFLNDLNVWQLGKTHQFRHFTCIIITSKAVAFKKKNLFTLSYIYKKITFITESTYGRTLLKYCKELSIHPSISILLILHRVTEALKAEDTLDSVMHTLLTISKCQSVYHARLWTRGDNRNTQRKLHGNFAHTHRVEGI